MYCTHLNRSCLFFFFTPLFALSCIHGLASTTKGCLSTKGRVRRVGRVCARPISDRVCTRPLFGRVCSTAGHVSRSEAQGPRGPSPSFGVGSDSIGKVRVVSRVSCLCDRCFAGIPIWLPYPMRSNGSSSWTSWVGQTTALWTFPKTKPRNRRENGKSNVIAQLRSLTSLQ
jgi:hypothetical protein